MTSRTKRKKKNLSLKGTTCIAKDENFAGSSTVRMIASSISISLTFSGASPSLISKQTVLNFEALQNKSGYRVLPDDRLHLSPLGVFGFSISSWPLSTAQTTMLLISSETFSA